MVGGEEEVDLLLECCARRKGLEGPLRKCSAWLWCSGVIFSSAARRWRCTYFVDTGTKLLSILWRSRAQSLSIFGCIAIAVLASFFIAPSCQVLACHVQALIRPHLISSRLFSLQSAIIHSLPARRLNCHTIFASATPPSLARTPIRGLLRPSHPPLQPSNRPSDWRDVLPEQPQTRLTYHPTPGIIPRPVQLAEILHHLLQLAVLLQVERRFVRLVIRLLLGRVLQV